jgi:hypothetical protein
MPHSKAEQLRIAERRAKVAQLYLQGIKQFEIAAQLGLEGAAGAMVVSRDLAAVRKAWAESATRDNSFAKGQLLSEIALLKRELWAAWDRSKQSKGGAPRPGDPRVVAQLLACLTQEAELLGLRAKPGEPPAVPQVVAFVVHPPPAGPSPANSQANGVTVDTDTAAVLPFTTRGKPPADDGEWERVE